MLRTKGWDRALSAQWYGMAIKLDLEARATSSAPALHNDSRMTERCAARRRPLIYRCH
ncbi:MAG: hypothetical protein M3O64_00410 [Chloroflexota bacterium]|nr:hypothetical protein [Chloroflexota bacterium]